MTTIIDPSVPCIDAGDAILDREASRSRWIVFAGAAAVTMTALNLAVAFYFYRGIDELRSIEQRLGQLSEFEGRIDAKIDSVNNGMQTRIEMLDRNLQGRIAEIRDRLEQIKQQPAPSQVETSMLPALEPQLEADNQDVSSDIAPAIEAAAEPVASPRPLRRASMPSPSTAYQRLETAEGKVYYRKVK